MVQVVELGGVGAQPPDDLITSDWFAMRCVREKAAKWGLVKREWKGWQKVPWEEGQWRILGIGLEVKEARVVVCGMHDKAFLVRVYK